MPRLSILIPTYNYAHFIAEALESIWQQSYSDFEVIVIDDASTDQTESVCVPFVKADPRIRFLRNDRNLGMVPNWNKCLECARGEYVKVLLADDRLNGSESLALQVGALEADARISIVTSSRAIIDEDSVTRELWDPLGSHDRRVRLREVESHMLQSVGSGMNRIGEPSAVMFRRRNAGAGFSESFRQLVDFEMWLRQMQHGELWYFKNPLCAFRRHGKQQSAVNSAGAVGELEELAIVRSYFASRPRGERWIARAEAVVWRRWSDSQSAILRSEAERIRSRFGPGQLAVARVRYRVSKIRQNLERVLRGRSARTTRVLRFILRVMGSGHG